MSKILVTIPFLLPSGWAAGIAFFTLSNWVFVGYVFFLAYDIPMHAADVCTIPFDYRKIVLQSNGWYEL